MQFAFHTVSFGAHRLVRGYTEALSSSAVLARMVCMVALPGEAFELAFSAELYANTCDS